MHALWGLGMLSLTKAVVVVDAHVDVHDYEQVFFYCGANVDPARDVVLADGPADHLDHATERQFIGGKLGIDATAKLPEEGAREWPDEIEMRPDVVELVSRRWAEYGIATDPSPRNGEVRHSSGRLLRR
jgi:4-hydroxy-3-polyprenylbenzoate decarboxylase